MKKRILAVVCLAIFCISILLFYCLNKKDDPIICYFCWSSWDRSFDYPGLDAFLITDDFIIYGIEKSDGEFYKKISNNGNQFSIDEFKENMQVFKEERISENSKEKLTKNIETLVKLKPAFITNISDINISFKGAFYSTSILRLYDFERENILEKGNDADKEESKNLQLDSTLNEFFSVLDKCISIDVKNPYNKGNQTSKSQETWSEENITKIYK